MDIYKLLSQQKPYELRAMAFAFGRRVGSNPNRNQIIRQTEEMGCESNGYGVEYREGYWRGIADYLQV